MQQLMRAPFLSIGQRLPAAIKNIPDSKIYAYWYIQAQSRRGWRGGSYQGYCERAAGGFPGSFDLCELAISVGTPWRIFGGAHVA